MSSKFFLFDGPSRQALLLGLFNPVVAKARRASHVRASSPQFPQAGIDTVVSIFGLQTTDPSRPMRPHVWVRLADDPDRVAVIHGYDVHKRNGEMTIQAHPWSGGEKPPEIFFRHQLDALDLMGQFCWREGQRHPIWINVIRMMSRNGELPSAAIKGWKNSRCALYLREVKQMETAPYQFRFEAEDLKGALWHGVIDLAQKNGTLSQGPHPTRS